LKKPRFVAWLFRFLIFCWQDSIFFSANKHGISPIPFLPMRTDALYLNLFETAPSLALRLSGCGTERANEYTCASLELKKAFRVDVVLTPPSVDLPLVLAEVQFQREPDIYHRLVASGAIARIQSPEYPDVRMVILFASRGVDTGAGAWQPLVDAGTLRVVYLDEATAELMNAEFTPEEQSALLLARLTVSPSDRTGDDVIVHHLGVAIHAMQTRSLQTFFRDLFVNLYVSKYKTLSIKEIRAMIDTREIFDDIGESLAVQEYAQEQSAKTTIANAVALVRAGINLEQVAAILHLSEAEIQAALLQVP